MFDGGVLSKGLRGGSSSTRNWLKATKELARGRAGPRPGGRGRARGAEGEGQGGMMSKTGELLMGAWGGGASCREAAFRQKRGLGQAREEAAQLIGSGL